MAFLFVVFIFAIIIAWIFKGTSSHNIQSYHILGWGKEYKRTFNLTSKEQALLNYITKDSLFAKHTFDYYYVSFFKFELVNLSITALRALGQSNKQSKEKARDICLYCDYLIREKYLFKRYSKNEITRLNNSLDEYEKSKISTLCNDVRPLTDEDEKKLFISDVARRDICYNKIVTEYKDSSQFYEDIKRLDSLNNYPSAKRNFYYKAYRFMVDKDRIISLKLYIHYLSISPDSTTNLSISKTNLKKLFEKEPKKIVFEQIVEQFKVDRDLDTALLSIDDLFVVKRKKVVLNEVEINSATEDLNSVVEVLNKYLEDEEIPKATIVAKQIEPTTTENDLSSLQTEFIDYFISKSYKLTNSEIDTFANSKGVFKSQLIDGFNEQFFEQLDDYLIEEEDNYYILNQNYYKQITKF